MEHIVDDLMTQFYKLNFDKVNQNSKNITKITEVQINLLTMPSAYLQAKMAGEKFQKYQEVLTSTTPKQQVKT